MASEIPPINPPLPALVLLRMVLEIVLMWAWCFADSVRNLVAAAILEARQNSVDGHPASITSEKKGSTLRQVDWWGIKRIRFPSQRAIHSWTPAKTPIQKDREEA